MTQSITILQVFPNKRRKTPLITTPLTKEAIAFYRIKYPRGVLKTVELDTKRSNRKEDRNNERLR